MYSMSFDVSCKVTRAEVRGYLKHTARDVDKANGKEVRHSNEDIDESRTHMNITRVFTPSGVFKKCNDSQELIDALESRLQRVKKPLRKDAVVLRPVILQLDPEWYEEHQEEQERKKSYNKMLHWAALTFGRDNLVGFSVHLDEANPHIHVLVTPVTDDGRLSQKEWFSGPAALRKMHQSLREHMRASGYDVDLERQKPGKYAKRMNEKEYKDYAELQRQREDLERQQEAIRQREAAVAIRERQATEAEQERLQEAAEQQKRSAAATRRTSGKCTHDLSGLGVSRPTGRCTHDLSGLDIEERRSGITFDLSL